MYICRYTPRQKEEFTSVTLVVSIIVAVQRNGNVVLFKRRERESETDAKDGAENVYTGCS